MPKTQHSEYVVGEHQEPSQGRGVPQERKSAPLASLLPDRDDYLMPSVQHYYDPACVELEWNKLWTKTWLCAGRVSDLAAKGCWFRFDLGRESFIIIRSGADEISAFYNVCQHRANRIVDEDFGSSRVFICPYHGWRYERDGKCSRVTDRELFRDGALKGSLDLSKIRCEVFAGFVFINMDPNAGSLAEYLGEVMDITSGYRAERMEVRGDVIVELACNWKTILDAFSENYHVHITHQFAMPVTEDKIGQMDFYPGGHTRRIVAIGDPALRLGNQSSLHPMQKFMLAEVGIDPESYTGGPRDVRRSIQQAKRAMGGAHREAYADLSDNQLTDDWAMNIFPNMHWSVHSEGMLTLRYYPHRSDPGRCFLHVMVLGHPGVTFDRYPGATQFEPSGRAKRVRIAHDDPAVKDRIGQLLFEDIRNTRETQLGLQSRGFDRMRLSEQEQSIMFQYAMINRYLRA